MLRQLRAFDVRELDIPPDLEHGPRINTVVWRLTRRAPYSPNAEIHTASMRGASLSLSLHSFTAFSFPPFFFFSPPPHSLLASVPLYLSPLHLSPLFSFSVPPPSPLHLFLLLFFFWKLVKVHLNREAVALCDPRLSVLIVWV